MNDNLILIEDKSIENFEPITSTRTSLEMQFGAGSFYEQLKKRSKIQQYFYFYQKSFKRNYKKKTKGCKYRKN